MLGVVVPPQLGSPDCITPGVSLLLSTFPAEDILGLAVHGWAPPLSYYKISGPLTPWKGQITPITGRFGSSLPTNSIYNKTQGF